MGGMTMVRLGVFQSLVLFSTVIAVPAQSDRPNRVITRLEGGGHAEWLGGEFMLASTPDSRGTVEVAVPDLAGDAMLVAGTGGGVEHILVAGRDLVANVGVLRVLSWDQTLGRFTGGVDREYRLPGADFTEVAFDPAGVLWLLNAGSGDHRGPCR